MKYILFTLSLLSSLFSFSQRYDGNSAIVNVKTKDDGGTYYFFLNRKDSSTFHCVVTPWGTNPYGIDSDSLYLVGQRDPNNGSASYRICVKDEISLSDLRLMATDSIFSIGFYFLGGKYSELKLKYKSRCELTDAINKLVNMEYSVNSKSSLYPLLALSPENGRTPGDYLIRSGSLRSASTLVFVATAVLGTILVSGESYSEDPTAANIAIIGLGGLGLGLHFGANGAEVKAGRLLNR